MRSGSYEVGRASGSGSAAGSDGDSQFLDLSHLSASEQLYAWWYTITPGLRDRLLLQGLFFKLAVPEITCLQSLTRHFQLTSDENGSPSVGLFLYTKREKMFIHHRP